MSDGGPGTSTGDRSDRRLVGTEISPAPSPRPRTRRTNFTALPNELIFDPKLSPEAKILEAGLRHLVLFVECQPSLRELSDRLGMGRGAIARARDELIAAQRLRVINGRGTRST